MKYAFIINPIAGNGKKARQSFAKKSVQRRWIRVRHEPRCTTGPGSATHIADKGCVCRADGESANHAVGMAQMKLQMVYTAMHKCSTWSYPSGSGNRPYP